MVKMYKKKYYQKPTEDNNVAVVVDGPNMLRKEFMIDLRELKRRVYKYGRMTIGKVFINQFAPDKLIEAIINEGFECEMLMAAKEDVDVDVAIAVAGMEAVLTKDIDVLVVVTRDADFLPLVQKGKEYGKKVIVMGAEPGFSVSLQNAADYVELL